MEYTRPEEESREQCSLTPTAPTLVPPTTPVTCCNAQAFSIAVRPWLCGPLNSTATSGDPSCCHSILSRLRQTRPRRPRHPAGSRRDTHTSGSGSSTTKLMSLVALADCSTRDVICVQDYKSRATSRIKLYLYRAILQVLAHASLYILVASGLHYEQCHQ